MNNQSLFINEAHNMSKLMETSLNQNSLLIYTREHKMEEGAVMQS